MRDGHGEQAWLGVGDRVDGPGVRAGDVAGEVMGRADEVAAGLRAEARRVRARGLVVAVGVGDEARAAVPVVGARHAEGAEEEVEPRAVRVGGGGGPAAVAAGRAAAVRELDAAAAARQVPRRALMVNAGRGKYRQKIRNLRKGGGL